MQGDSFCTRLAQILVGNFSNIDFALSRLLGVVMLVILCSRQIRFLGSAQYNESPRFINFALPGDISLPQPVCCSI